MRRALVGTIILALPLVGCESDEVLVPVDGPAPPRALDAYYYGGVVTVTWELASSISVPVTIVAGANSDSHPPDFLEALVRIRSHSREEFEATAAPVGPRKRVERWPNRCSMLRR